MGQKVNPISFRLSVKKNWRSKWFNDKKYPLLVAQDIIIRKAISKKLGRNAGINLIEIERNPQETTINIHTSKPGIIIGRSGQGVNELKDSIIKEIQKSKFSLLGIHDQKYLDFTTKIKINIIEVRNPETCSALIAQNIASQLEKRIAYRRAIKMAIEKAMQNKEVKGIKVGVAGRLGGVEIARREKFSKGSIPLSTFRSNIDYTQLDAFTTFGTIGIKVWVYKNN